MTGKNICVNSMIQHNSKQYPEDFIQIDIPGPIGLR